jgi:succinate dehydrogenase / fumarate reductase membrane anchor subunit
MAWWVQRVSAVYMLFFTLSVLASFGLEPMHVYGQWRAWIARPGVSLAFLIFSASLLAHVWVGLRDVLLDYARPAGLRGGLLATVAMGLAGLGVWTLSILLRLHR